MWRSNGTDRREVQVNKKASNCSSLHIVRAGAREQDRESYCATRRVGGAASFAGDVVFQELWANHRRHIYFRGEYAVALAQATLESVKGMAGLRRASQRLARTVLPCLMAFVVLVACEVVQQSAPTPLTSTQVFDKVSPSIAFIETADRQGAGVLIEGGHLLTNAQIVWPYHTVRVVFPDGSEYFDVPVKGLDLIADLAVLGPISAPTGTLEFVDGEGLPNGNKIYVIGYPEATGDFPQPTIISRRLASVQHWRGFRASLIFRPTPSSRASRAGGCWHRNSVT